jgi:hypothetical protein
MIRTGLVVVPTVLTFFAATAAFAYDVDDIQRASGTPPTFRTLPGGQGVFEYDLKVQNLCDNATSLNTVASAWVGPKRGFFDIKDRSVALAAVVTFPGARNDQIKQVKVPLIAKANFGDAAVQNCDGTIVTDIPANTKMKLHFEFRQSATIRFDDPTKFIGGIAKVGSSALALGAAASGAGVIGATIVPVVSYIEKNSNAITTLNTGVNDIMASFGDVRSPDPRQYEIRPTASHIIYRSGRTPVITIAKITRDSGIQADGLNGWPGVYSAFSARYGDLQSQFNNAQNAVESPWSGSLPKFCGKLRAYIDGVTKGDRFGSALGVGYHAFYNSTEYGGKTCLNSWEIAALKAHKFAPPYPDAWLGDTPRAPAVAAASPRRTASAPARVASASMNR